MMRTCMSALYECTCMERVAHSEAVLRPKQRCLGSLDAKGVVVAIAMLDESGQPCVRMFDARQIEKVINVLTPYSSLCKGPFQTFPIKAAPGVAFDWISKRCILHHAYYIIYSLDAQCLQV